MTAEIIGVCTFICVLQVTHYMPNIAMKALLGVTMLSLMQCTLCSEKNTHLHLLSYLHELFVDLNKKCSEYTQGLADSENLKIRYSLRSMT